MINRDKYLNKMISKKNNGLIKVITGVRRSGKSYLLNNIFKNYLTETGVKEENIISLALDEDINIKYRNPLLLGEYIRERITNKNEQYFIFLDEIQKVENIQNPYIDNKESLVTFVDVLLGLMKLPNCDIYVTGSNSKMLSSDILTEFRDRGDEIRIYPLSFKEFYDYKKIDKSDAYELKLRGFDVDIGVVEYNYKDENGKNKRKQLEVDFIASKFNKKYYIQSALTITNEDKIDQELNSLKRINDSFKKVILVKENIMPWYDNNGILYLGIYDFLLNEDSLDI